MTCIRAIAMAAAVLLPSAAMAGQEAPGREAVVSWPFYSTAAVPCDNVLRSQSVVVDRVTRLKKVFIWQGLSHNKVSDVTMNLYSQDRAQNFVVAGHDDYTNGADGGRQFSEDFGGLYYTIPAGDLLTFTYGCSRNPDLPMHWMGFMVQFIAAGAP